MAAITVNERFVKLVRVDESIAPAISAGPLDAATAVAQNAQGAYAAGPGASGEVSGLVVETVLAANAPISVLKKGILDLGDDALAAIDPETVIYATPTGTLDTAATGNVRVGKVFAGRGDLAGDGVQRKLLRVDC